MFLTSFSSEMSCLFSFYPVLLFKQTCIHFSDALFSHCRPAAACFHRLSNQIKSNQSLFVWLRRRNLPRGAFYPSASAALNLINRHSYFVCCCLFVLSLRMCPKINGRVTKDYRAAYQTVTSRGRWWVINHLKGLLSNKQKTIFFFTHRDKSVLLS